MHSISFWASSRGWDPRQQVSQICNSFLPFGVSADACEASGGESPRWGSLLDDARCRLRRGGTVACGRESTCFLLAFATHPGMSDQTPFHASSTKPQQRTLFQGLMT